MGDERYVLRAVQTLEDDWTVVTSELGYVAKQFPELTEADRAGVGEFLQMLEDHDDVQRVWAAVK